MDFSFASFANGDDRLESNMPQCTNREEEPVRFMRAAENANIGQVMV
ncbi:MAG TPA: hypothetical protein VMV10_29320 [Pirellulales bacterium]|nr:hypothetical protein [Pirellulales bacterium]